MSAELLRALRPHRAPGQSWPGWFFAADGAWSRRRVVGETVLLLVIVLAEAGTTRLVSGSWSIALGTGALVLVLALLRHRFPAIALFFPCGLVVPWTFGGVALLILTSWNAGKRIRSGREAVLVALISLVLVVIGGFVEMDGGRLTVLAWCIGLYGVLVLVPGLAGRYRSQQSTMLRLLAERNAQLEHEQRLVAHQARLRERTRIAQDMHDSLGHRLSLIAVHSGALQATATGAAGTSAASAASEAERQAAVTVLREASVDAMRELREVIGILKDAGDPEDTADVPDRESTDGGSAALDRISELVASSRTAGLPVRLESDGEEPYGGLSPATGHAAFRVVRESLTNVHKHATGADTRVALRHEPDALVVEVVNGRMPEAARPVEVGSGQGLAGLDERVRLVGGLLRAVPTGDGGFRVTAMLPYTAEPAGPVVAVRSPERTQLPEPVRESGGAPAQESGGAPGREPAPAEIVRLASSRRNLALGCGVVAAALVVCVTGLVVWAAPRVLSAFENSYISPRLYKSFKVGQSEDAVRGRLRPSASLLTGHLAEAGPPQPVRGAECVYYIAEGVAPAPDKELGYRFCFAGGRLVSKDKYVSDTV